LQMSLEIWPAGSHRIAIGRRCEATCVRRNAGNLGPPRCFLSLEQSQCAFMPGARGDPSCDRAPIVLCISQMQLLVATDRSRRTAYRLLLAVGFPAAFAVTLWLAPGKTAST